MAEKIRFHLDENVDPDIAAALRKSNIDVTTSQEANLLSRSDTAQLGFATSQSRVLMTHDDDFLILHSQGIKHSGIVYCRKDTKLIGHIIRMLVQRQSLI